MLKKIRNIAVMSIALALILFVAVIPNEYNIFQKAKYEKLDVKTFEEKYRSTPNAVLLDVRTPEEVAEGKIDGSVNINFDGDNFHQQLDTLDKSKIYFIYCKAGGRSGETCDYLAEKGYKVYSLKDGLDAWNEEKH